MTTTRKLETTPAMVAQSMAAYSQMELAMCMEGWLVTDAGAAHELLALVRLQHTALLQVEGMSGTELQAARDAAAPWIEA